MRPKPYFEKQNDLLLVLRKMPQQKAKQRNSVAEAMPPLRLAEAEKAAQLAAPYP